MLEWLMIACIVVGGVHAYPSGPPFASNPTLCATMFPSGHNATAKTTAAPFELIVDTANCYNTTDIIVTAQVKAPSPSWFEGLLIEARLPGATALTASSEGTFTVLAANAARFKTSGCFAKANNVVHQSNKEHYGCRSFKWRAPTGFTKTIEFVATMVHETDVFWMNVKSAQISYKATCAAGTGKTCSKDVPRIPKPNSAGMPELHVTAMFASLLLLLTSFQ